MPLDPNVHDMLREAAALRQAGRLVEAEAAYRRTLALAPDLANSWYNLAWLQRNLGQAEAALTSYQQALDRGVATPEEVHLNRAVIYADELRQDDCAERELKRALALNPTYVPALLNLANLEEDRGRRGEAAALYCRILEIDPLYFEALARGANCTAFVDADDPIITKLREALARADVGRADRASLGFALGRALDACARYEDAFKAYGAANQASRESSLGPAYDPSQHERFINSLIEAFPDAPSPPAAILKSPLFICGMFRSGSTLAEQVLSSHRRVTAGGEINFLPACVAAELSPFPQSMKTVKPELLSDIAARYADRVAKLFPGADIVTDKRPDNFLYIGLIKTLFPEAKIIHTVRNPLDNCLSVFFLHLDHSMSYALGLEDIGHYYRQYRRLMAHWDKLYGDDIFRFDYDAFVHEPEPALRQLLEFCGLDWDDTLLEFHRRDSVVKTASLWQVREPLYQRASGRWRHYEPHLAALRASLPRWRTRSRRRTR